MVKVKVQQYLTKPKHCIWPIRTRNTFVSTNEQFAPEWRQPCHGTAAFNYYHPIYMMPGPAHPISQYISIPCYVFYSLVGLGLIWGGAFTAAKSKSQSISYFYISYRLQPSACDCNLRSYPHNIHLRNMLHLYALILVMESYLTITYQ